MASFQTAFLLASLEFIKLVRDHLQILLLLVMCRFKWINFYSLLYHRLSDDFIFQSGTASFQKIIWPNLSLSSSHFWLEFFSCKNKFISGRSVFRRTLRTVSLLMDGRIPAFIITLFLHKSFPFILTSASFVVIYFYFVEKTVLVVFSDCPFVTSKSPIFFFIFLQIDAFEYFQYYLIFDVSE